jgi:hypothetical protein
MNALNLWRMVRAHLDAVRDGTILNYDRGALPHPRDAGAVLSLGWPKGQLADYRFAAERDCRGMHVHEFVTDRPMKSTCDRQSGSSRDRPSRAS